MRFPPKKALVMEAFFLQIVIYSMYSLIEIYFWGKFM